MGETVGVGLSQESGVEGVGAPVGGCPGGPSVACSHRSAGGTK